MGNHIRDLLKIATIILLILQEVLDITRLAWDLWKGRGCHWYSYERNCQNPNPPRWNTPYFTAFWILLSVALFLSNSGLTYAVIKEVWDYIDFCFQIGIIKCFILLIDLIVAIIKVTKDRSTSRIEIFHILTPTAFIFVILFFAIACIQALIVVLLCLLSATSYEGSERYKLDHICSSDELREDEVIKSGRKGKICMRTIMKKITVFLIILVIVIYFYIFLLSLNYSYF